MNSVRVICLMAALVLASCSKPTDNAVSEKPAPLTMKRLVAATAGQFQPVPLPDPGIAGYKFPEPEDTIVGWTKADNQKAMNLHAWGIWTALTQISDQVFDGQKLHVFETWYDPTDLMSTNAQPAAQTRTRDPRRLEVPHQFEHGGAQSLLAQGTHGQQTVLAFVKYDPTGSKHIVDNNLFSKAQLTTLLNTDHKPSVPDFPNPSISLKPVFITISASSLANGRYFQMKSWPGPPGLVFNQSTQMWESKPFPSSAWGQCVWIDVQDTGRKPGNTVDKTCAANGSSRTDASTYGVDQFVKFKLSKTGADFVNARMQKTLGAAFTAPSAPGDYAVLVAMHVTSREITRWTWQTFWWSYNPDKPFAPSSAGIAADRPPQLTGAPRHYAHCVAYDEVMPPQPNSGGSNTGESVYCYNPYLEAPFSPGVLPDSQPGMTKNGGKPVKTPNNVGVQTNCMSCHEQANFNPNNVATAPNYTGDRYVDLNGPAFNGVLKVDFLWSIPGNAQ
jgi:hypothetical protein